MICKFTTVQLIFLFMLIYTISPAQETNKGYFIIPKFGLYGSNIWKGTAFSIEGGVLRNNTSFGIAYTQTIEILGFDNSWAADFTIGRFRRESSAFYLHAETGISTLWIDKWSIQDEKIKNFFTVGLPLKAGIKYIPPHFLSMGIDLEANINSKRSMFMIMLTLGVWHVRE